jgi:hypothetical protein
MIKENNVTTVTVAKKLKRKKVELDEPKTEE